MFAKSNTLRQKFHMCSTAVKVKLFTAYFSNVYMCALWVNYRKTTFHQFMVAYNNSYRILNRLPMRCSASGMFATDNVNSCTCVGICVCLCVRVCMGACVCETFAHRKGLSYRPILNDIPYHIGPMPYHLLSVRH